MVHKEQGNAVLWTVAAIGGVIALVTIVPLLLALLGLINLPFLKFQDKVALNQGVINKTYDTQYCLDNYHYFLETDQDIQQKEQQVQSFQAQLTQMKQDYGSDMSKWSFTAQQTYNEVSSELTGVQNARLDEVGQYNAKTQELDRVSCKSLPLYIQP